MRNAQACNQGWGKRPPPAFTGFKDLFTLFKKGKMPLSGEPQPFDLDDPTKYPALLADLPDKLAGTENICVNTLNKRLCAQTCDLKDEILALSQAVNGFELSSLATVNTTTQEMKTAKAIAGKLILSTQRCNQQFGRNPPPALTAVTTIAKRYDTEVSMAMHREQAEIARQKKAEELSLEQERQQQLLLVQQRKVEENKRIEKAEHALNQLAMSARTKHIAAMKTGFMSDQKELDVNNFIVDGMFHKAELMALYLGDKASLELDGDNIYVFSALSCDDPNIQHFEDNLHAYATGATLNA